MNSTTKELKFLRSEKQKDAHELKLIKNAVYTAVARAGRTVNKLETVEAAVNATDHKIGICLDSGGFFVESVERST
jgi:beta-phosphoglucomutase-like phosphatase (HAD superfamily)